MTEQEEAQRVVRAFVGNTPGLLNFLSGQLSVLKSQAQMLMGLCGLIITVTGFSGAQMVRGGLFSTSAMIGGIALTLLAVVGTLQTLSQLRWVSQDLADDLTQTALAVILRRNQQQRALTRAGGLVAAGLAAYLLAVVLAAVSAGLSGRA